MNDIWKEPWASMSYYYDDEYERDCWVIYIKRPDDDVAVKIATYETTDGVLDESAILRLANYSMTGYEIHVCA